MPTAKPQGRSRIGVDYRSAEQPRLPGHDEWRWRRRYICRAPLDVVDRGNAPALTGDRILKAVGFTAQGVVHPGKGQPIELLLVRPGGSVKHAAPILITGDDTLQTSIGHDLQTQPSIMKLHLGIGIHAQIINGIGNHDSIFDPAVQSDSVIVQGRIVDYTEGIMRQDGRSIRTLGHGVFAVYQSDLNAIIVLVVVDPADLDKKRVFVIPSLFILILLVEALVALIGPDTALHREQLGYRYRFGHLLTRNFCGDRFPPAELYFRHYRRDRHRERS